MQYLGNILTTIWWTARKYGNLIILYLTDSMSLHTLWCILNSYGRFETGRYRNINIGYFTVVRKYGFYVPVAIILRTISHE